MKKVRGGWCSIHDLKNASLKETLADVIANLVAMGWSADNKPTEKARLAGAVRGEGPQRQWNKTRYLAECRRLRRQNRETRETSR